MSSSNLQFKFTSLNIKYSHLNDALKYSIQTVLENNLKLVRSLEIATIRVKFETIYDNVNQRIL